MERGIPAVPKMYFYVGDVRDVAHAHIKATTVPEAAGKLISYFITLFSIVKMSRHSIDIRRHYRPSWHDNTPYRDSGL